ncbi:hypothetical protein DEO72_LG9g1046 [Vigna unguiculata]|uniref:Uncharacterized protein n=1 Tax=Vigna unguiculata TaxID=3917 RepID=A0A4D6N201_VIGUN|nr:hypothetical protein DEO72_LG9g1046 [Vigna unguiculata]
MDGGALGDDGSPSCCLLTLSQVGGSLSREMPSGNTSMHVHTNKGVEGSPRQNAEESEAAARGVSFDKGSEDMGHVKIDFADEGDQLDLPLSLVTSGLPMSLEITSRGSDGGMI